MRAATIVIPCFNEARRLQPAAFADALQRWPWLSLLFVDDGSTDATLQVLERLRDDLEGQVTLLALADNVGKAEAVRRGVLAAMAAGTPTVGYWDADLSTPLDELEPMCTLLETRGATLVLGSRVKLLGRQITRLAGRHYTGRVFATLASLALDLPVYDTQCGAKAFRNDAVMAEVFARPFVSRWIFDVELLARLLLHQREQPAAFDFQRQVVEHPLTRWAHRPGSKLGAGHRLRALYDLAQVFWLLRQRRA